MVVNLVSGSKVGGQVIIIFGSGFGYKKENVLVLFDGFFCDIFIIIMFQIICRIFVYLVGIVFVDILVDDSFVIVLDIFEYDLFFIIDVISVSLF